MTTSLENDTKKCPYCAEDVLSAAVLCRYCGKSLKRTSVDFKVFVVSSTLGVLIVLFLTFFIWRYWSLNNRFSSETKPAYFTLFAAVDSALVYSWEVGTYEDLKNRFTGIQERADGLRSEILKIRTYNKKDSVQSNEMIKTVDMLYDYAALQLTRYNFFIIKETSKEEIADLRRRAHFLRSNNIIGSDSLHSQADAMLEEVRVKEDSLKQIEDDLFNKRAFLYAQALQLCESYCSRYDVSKADVLKLTQRKENE